MLPILLACADRAPHERVEPAFLEVELGQVETGSPDAPLPFTSELVEVPVSVRALGSDGELHAFDGDLVVKVRPGQLDGDPWIEVEDGEWSGTVAIKNGFGPTRVWFTDEGDKDSDSERVASWAVGVSDPLHFEWPTIAEFQSTDDPATNQLDKEFAWVRVADRDVVVTARDAAGLWVTDTSDPDGSFNSVYVYTFSRPDEEMVVGARVTELTGIDQEYLESTQLSFPTLATDGTTLDVPDPVVLDGCEDLVMEGLEAARVVVVDGEIPEGFVDGSEDWLDYEEYGQWPLSAGDCTFYVESGTTAPDFDPADHVGAALPEVRGMLKQVFDKWILVVTDEEDILTPDDAR